MPNPTSMLFDATFSTDQNVPFTAILFAYDDQALVDHAKVEWAGSQWNITALSTPEPTSLLLLGAGLFGLEKRRKLRWKFLMTFNGPRSCGPFFSPSTIHPSL